MFRFSNFHSRDQERSNGTRKLEEEAKKIETQSSLHVTLQETEAENF